MSLPASLLTAVSGHRCFTGCYRPEPSTTLCVDPAQSLAPALQAVCSECVSFRVGALTSALSKGVTAQGFADELCAHARSVRGYVWSTSGYSPSGRLWLSAAYYGNGLFLVDGSRNGNQCTDLDMLILAFRQGVVTPDDPRMLTSSLYTAEVVYLDMSQSMGPVRDKQDLLAHPGCRTTRSQGYQRASILEFVPMARSALPQRSASIFPAPAVRPLGPATLRSSTPAPSPAPATPVTPDAFPAPSPGSALACPHCGAEIKERALFSSTYVGCLC